MTEHGIKVVIELPAFLTPDAADEKYTEPLRSALNESVLGEVISAEQGKPNTPEESSRIITIELTEYEPGLDVIAECLAIQGAPPCTTIVSYHENGEKRDIFMTGPE